VLRDGVVTCAAADVTGLDRLILLPDFGILLALALALGPVGTEGDGLPPGESRPPLCCADAAYAARRASAAARKVWFSTLSWR